MWGRFLISGLTICLFSMSLTAKDWPQWRGPDRNGMSTESGLLDQWPEGGPELAWRSSGLGAGYSTVSVSGNQIFTLGDVDGAQYIIAVDRKNGEIQWKTKIGIPWEHQRWPGPRGTPTVEGGHVYAVSTEGGVYCVNAKSGEVVWNRDLVKDFGGFMSAGQNVDWKFSESPLIDGDRVIVTPGSNDAALVALNKKTGKEIWRSKIPNLGERGADGAGYSSVMISNGAGVKQYIQMLGRGVVGIEAATGKYLWGYNRVANDVANITTPIIKDDHIFVTTGYGTGSALLKVRKDGDGVAADQVYWLEGSTLQNHHGGYIYTGTGHNKGLPICVNMKDGSVKWGPIRNEGKGSAAVTYADGNIYMRYQNGLMVLMEANSKEYKEKGSFMIPDVKQFSWAHPVIAGGHLYLREQDNLFAYKISK